MKSVREYLDVVESHGQLERLSGVDWDLEIGAISDIARKYDLGSAILFDDIEGYDAGYRVLTNTFDTPLQASLALGYEPTTSMREAVVAHKEHASVTGTEPVETVDTGPVMENVLEGEEIDLTAFPVPKWHRHDGGRYIGTADIVVTRNADTGKLNAGTYRVQVHGPRTATVYISPGKDGRINKDSYLDRDEPVPVILSVGQAPDLFCTANHRLSADVNELEYAGARRGEPIEVIEGELTGLPISSRAEIVLEGHIYPDAEPVTEGPFGEWTGYYGSGTNDELPMTVERVYHRDNPIITGYNNAITPSALTVIRSAAIFWDELEEAGVPGVQAVNSFMPSSYLRVVSIEQQYAGHSTQVGMQSVSLPAGAYHGRYTVIVDDDIDVYDWEEVKWAMTSRCDPAEDIHVVEDCWSTYLDPMIPPERKREGDLTNSRAVIDATRPYHWREEFPEDAKISRELEMEMLATYGDELFESPPAGPTEADEGP
jgi:UbiD family decarboxylase